VIHVGASNHVQQNHAMGDVVTGLLYVDPEPADLHSHLGTIAEPLNRLGASELSPGLAALDKINARLR
jgi:2-oxoglutarate ferredoxin oxidoreductase subunit beta